MRAFILALLALATSPLAFAQEDPEPLSSFIQSSTVDVHSGIAKALRFLPQSHPAIMTSMKIQRWPRLSQALPILSAVIPMAITAHVPSRHCEGPATPTTAAPVPPAISSQHDDDGHATVTPTVPSPTESIGCEPHGDHWHCEGPHETGTTPATEPTSSASGSPTPSPPAEFDGAAGTVRPEGLAFLAVAVVAAYYV
ncbi:predicted protein [Uncinocarpus reesii 1704]|uniref:Uncharacterized protein n=1 Tax=Uncinocarpus reesii (strain UAMH 1704) TaxID=336963 RepID=C4JJL1_UNCRE|nr:uncharacterized protein UREG_01818 [Uncinocarpus reesii 1704]EEP76969.1 predicted protein [Uncinocarpus reesii 1704]